MSWQGWRSEFEEAIEGSGYTIENVERLIGERVFQFWETQASAMITETVIFPGGDKVIISKWAAGDMGDILENLRPRLEVAAKDSGCVSALVESRPGWVRALKPYGYEPFSVTVRKVL